MYMADTIAAIATPPGEGGVSIVRISGPEAEAMAADIFLRSRHSNGCLKSHPLYPGKIRDPRSQRVLDETLLTIMRKPRSYSGEDVVEIHCHGGAFLVRQILGLTLRQGARQAEPGEFTKRAFLNGRLDLSQAEAVLDTIRATSSAGLNVAQRHLRGDLAREVEQARTSLLIVLAQVEAGIDFVDEDISFLQRDELVRIVRDACAVVHKLEATAQEGRMLRDGAHVVILGRPNVGKS